MSSSEGCELPSHKLPSPAGAPVRVWRRQMVPSAGTLSGLGGVLALWHLGAPPPPPEGPLELMQLHSEGRILDAASLLGSSGN